ncbi:hypothetical protein ACFU99_00680 [Streptomyces sp. NPDC057654]|uniref:hypothetical protein n=1 Tax=Streptomyces sp. NPDC057654 TaxID=3346196 RepID=UPI0036C418BC
MDDHMENTDPTVMPEGSNPQGESPEMPAVDVDLSAEVDKWRSLSRENEKRWKAASKELDQARQAQMTEQEKAIEEAKEQARQAAYSEVGTTLVEAEIRAEAASQGVTAVTDYLDLSRFLGEDGRPDRDRVAKYISSLSPEPAAEPEFPQLRGTGHYNSSRNVISSMDPTELADLITGGSFI